MPGSLNPKSLKARELLLEQEPLVQALELELLEQAQEPLAREQHQECPVLMELPHHQLAFRRVFLQA